eukprot:CAMPEP_0178386712 /NCGR_PEP_ID=MMETSP0689_2-20121128/8701_1 /TAXON_ID=160604 /ORGANISM="Amphidinium massartii, Strain CS-259" /LENGTH=89 /DNA_ID=CAMNT_0020007057 /DNA_START=198 /DNA_END=467 /DNA_ORIENTATION=-
MAGRSRCISHKHALPSEAPYPRYSAKKHASTPMVMWYSLAHIAADCHANSPFPWKYSSTRRLPTAFLSSLKSAHAHTSLSPESERTSTT